MGYEEVEKKEPRSVRVMAIVAFAAFTISMYIFFMSYITPVELGNESLEEQGAIMYTLNIANPINIIGGINPIILIGVLAAIIAIVLFAIILIIYSKISKIKKMNNLQINPASEYQENTSSQKNFSGYNKKVLELLDEGKRYLERNEYTNARIVYHKIRQWYDPHNDKSREIYLKIIRFYEKITQEEI